MFDDFGLLIEYEDDADDNTTFFVSLVLLDFYELKFKKLQTVEYFGTNLLIDVNKLDPAEFVLHLETDGEWFTRICCVVGKSFVAGEPIQLLYPCSYFDGHFYFWFHSEVESDLIHVRSFFVFYLIFEHFRKLSFMSTASNEEPMKLLSWACQKDTTCAE